jgi:GT2 family glycosyltransferase
MNRRSEAAVTAIVTAYQRIDAVLETLARVRACDPSPDEIIVHVDGGEHATASAIVNAFPDIRVIISPSPVGPGGGRNRMAEAARNEIVASFDDDSYPIDVDYFDRLRREFDAYPAAWVVDARVFHLHDAAPPLRDAAAWVADFTGCGCAYRRSRFLQVGGYVPLPTAYGMEEVDFSLRMHALGGRVLKSERLRVHHHSDLAHHAQAFVTSASIVNLALLTYLRYPISMWLIGMGQCANRIQWLLRHDRSRGIGRGLLGILPAVIKHRSRRNAVPGRTLRSYLALRRRPQPV